MKKKVLIGTGGLVVIFIILIGIGAAMQPSKPGASSASNSAPLTSAKTWQTIADWQGSGIKNTERFTTQTGEWRVKWTAGNEPFQGAGIIQIMVYDSKGGLVTLAANQQGNGDNNSYVRSNPGQYYLTINSANLDWRVTVEEQRAGASGMDSPGAVPTPSILRQEDPYLTKAKVWVETTKSWAIWAEMWCETGCAISDSEQARSELNDVASQIESYGDVAPEMRPLHDLVTPLAQDARTLSQALSGGTDPSNVIFDMKDHATQAQGEVAYLERLSH